MESLKRSPQSRKIDIYKSLQNFRLKYYLPQFMTLAVQSQGNTFFTAAAVGPAASTTFPPSYFHSFAPFPASPALLLPAVLLLLLFMLVLLLLLLLLLPFSSFSLLLPFLPLLLLLQFLFLFLFLLLTCSCSSSRYYYNCDCD